MVYRAISALLTLALVAAVPLPALPTDTGTGQQPTTVSNPVTGTLPPGGKGPGMGRAYQKSTPGPGWGSPDHRGGYSGDPAAVTGTSSTPPDTPYNRGPDTSSQQYGRPGYGRGGRGYGYGYPGYRGQGGSGYPQHRQYGNPPRYPAWVTPGEQAAPRQ